MTSLEMENTLRAKLQATHVEVIDESAQHNGHSLSSGGGHFALLVVSPLFEGQGLIDRHRRVYEALSMGSNPAIHALSMKTLTPDEWTKKT